MKTFLPIIVFLIIFIPTINMGGIPLRSEDILAVVLLLYIAQRRLFISNEFTNIIAIFVLFIVVNILSLVVAVIEGYQPNVQDFNTIALYCKSCLFLFCGYYIGKYLAKQSLNYIILSFGLCIFASSIIAIIQYFNSFGIGEKLYVLYGSESNIKYGINRVIGVFGNPNYASYFHSVGFLLGLNLIPKGKVRRSYIYIYLFVCFLGVALTFSRTGIISLFLAWIVALILQKGYRHVFALLGGVLMLGMVYLDKIVSGTRFGQILGQGDSLGVSNFGNRSNLIWSKRVEDFFLNPIIGSGPSKNKLSSTIFGATTYDNSYLLLLLTSGVVGLFLIIVLYYRLLKPYLRSNNILRHNLRAVTIPIYLLTAMFFLTTDLIWNIYFVSYFYLLLGVSFSYYSIQLLKANGATN